MSVVNREIFSSGLFWRPRALPTKWGESGSRARPLARLTRPTHREGGQEDGGNRADFGTENALHSRMVEKMHSNSIHDLPRNLGGCMGLCVGRGRRNGAGPYRCSPSEGGGRLLRWLTCSPSACAVGVRGERTPPAPARPEFSFFESCRFHPLLLRFRILVYLKQDRGALVLSSPLFFLLSLFHLYCYRSTHYITLPSW